MEIYYRLNYENEISFVVKGKNVNDNYVVYEWREKQKKYISYDWMQGDVMLRGEIHGLLIWVLGRDNNP